jgi:predicted RNA-binding protein YlxR (DUF448 family)
VGKGRGHIPVRTCVSCGAKKPKNELMRLVVGEAGFVRDDLGRGRGKGAYICNAEACREQVLKGKRRPRVFRSEKPVRASAGSGKRRHED